MIRIGTCVSLALTASFALPVVAEAKTVTITTKLKDYAGYNAFLALYVTDASGAYKGTLWLAGTRPRYFRHLSDWYQASGGDMSQLDGITGASIGSGRSLKISVDLQDAVLAAGYQIHVDVAAEGERESPSDVVVPLDSASSGKSAGGRRYIESFQYVVGK